MNLWLSTPLPAVVLGALFIFVLGAVAGRVPVHWRAAGADTLADEIRRAVEGVLTHARLAQFLEIWQVEVHGGRATVILDLGGLLRNDSMAASLTAATIELDSEAALLAKFPKMQTRVICRLHREEIPDDVRQTLVGIFMSARPGGQPVAAWVDDVQFRAATLHRGADQSHRLLLEGPRALAVARFSPRGALLDVTIRHLPVLSAAMRGALSKALRDAMFERAAGGELALSDSFAEYPSRSAWAHAGGFSLYLTGPGRQLIAEFDAKGDPTNAVRHRWYGI